MLRQKRVDLDVGAIFDDKYVELEVKNVLKDLSNYIAFCAYQFKDNCESPFNL